MPLLKSFRCFLTTDISSLENALAAKALDLGEIVVSIFSRDTSASAGSQIFADVVNVLAKYTDESTRYASANVAFIPNRVNPVSYNIAANQIPIMNIIDMTNAGTLVGSFYFVAYNPNGSYYMYNTAPETPPFNGTALQQIRYNNGTYFSGVQNSIIKATSVEGLSYLQTTLIGPYFGSIDPDGQITSLTLRSEAVLKDTSPSTSYFRTHSLSTSDANALKTFLNDAPNSPVGTDTDPYNDLPVPGDDPIPGGGTIAIPGDPALSATSTGIFGLFSPSLSEMQLLADFMWTDFGGTGSTVEDILKEIVEALKRTISNPLDYVLGLNIIPSQGLVLGAAKVVRFGFVSSGVSMQTVASQYFNVDCGSLSFDTLCGDSFLDYAPYSKFSLYLPFIGFKDVDPNDFVGHTIGVKYKGDVVTGGITAYVTKDGSVMYQYSGSCALNVPLSADNWGETISAAVGLASGIVAAAASGGAAGLAAGALKGAGSVAANPSLLSPQVSHSGAVSGSAGCLGVLSPFVIREAVNFHSTAGFNKSAGYPAYYYRKLGDVAGYTTVIEAHMSNIPMATQDEISEIESLLESGVIL